MQMLKMQNFGLLMFNEKQNTFSTIDGPRGYTQTLHVYNSESKYELVLFTRKLHRVQLGIATVIPGALTWVYLLIYLRK